MNLHRHSVTSTTSNHSNRSNLIQQQPLFCFDVYIHQIHFNLNSYFEDMSQYPFTLGFRLWDFPLVYMELPTVQRTPCPLRKGKSCLFHLPTLKKLHAYLNSFPLYFFLFQRKSLMGAASISLQEMRHNNLASNRSNSESAFISVLSGKFKLLTLEGFESGSIECDFRLRHVTDRNKLQYQSIQHLNPSNGFISKTSTKEFLYEDNQKDEDIPKYPPNFIETNTLNDKQINEMLDKSSRIDPRAQSFGVTRFSHPELPSTDLGDSMTSVRNDGNVNSVLQLIDAYKIKQNESEEIKKTLEFTLQNMKNQLKVVENAVVSISSNSKKRKKWKKPENSLRNTSFKIPEHSFSSYSQKSLGSSSRPSSSLSSRQSRPTSSLSNRNASYSSSTQPIKSSVNNATKNTISKGNTPTKSKTTIISKPTPGANKNASKRPVSAIPFSLGHVASETPKRNQIIYSSSDDSDIEEDHPRSSKSVGSSRSSETESLNSSVDDATYTTETNSIQVKSKAKEAKKEIALDEENDDFKVQDAHHKKQKSEDFSLNDEDLGIDEDFLDEFEDKEPKKEEKEEKKENPNTHIEAVQVDKSNNSDIDIDDVDDVVSDGF